MTKTKGKKTAKGAAQAKKPAAAGKTTKKQNHELSDDDLKQVSGGVMLANIAPGPTQTAPTAGKWIEVDSFSFGQTQNLGQKWLPR